MRILSRGVARAGFLVGPPLDRVVRPPCYWPSSSSTQPTTPMQQRIAYPRFLNRSEQEYDATLVPAEDASTERFTTIRELHANQLLRILNR